MSDLVHRLIEENKSTKASFLDLGNCGLKSVPEGVFELTWLIQLNLGAHYFKFGYNTFNNNKKHNLNIKNRLSVDSLCQLNQLPHLKTLYLNANNIWDLRFIKNLPQLQNLDLSENQISDISYINDLFQLQSLNLRENQIRDIRYLSNLTQLQDLNLGINRVSDIQPLRNLTQLQVLSINQNDISSIQYINKLNQLHTLDLRKNWIIDFPGNMLKAWPLLKNLYVSGNPLKGIPKEHFEGKNENALKELTGYFTSLDQGSLINDEVKLIVMGNTTTGKTSLMQFISQGLFKKTQNSTHGIALTRWPIIDSTYSLHVNVWDFGGQEYYHATHRLFLDDHAVYIVVWEVTTNKEGILLTDIYLAGKKYEIPLEHFPYSYWLDSIRYYAPNSTILLVQNKIDRSGIENVPDEYFKPIYSVYPPAYHISLYKANEGKGKSTSQAWAALNAFETQLLDTLQTDSVRYILGKGWIAIRDAIRQLPKNQYLMKYTEFENFCQKVTGELTPPIQFNTAIEMKALLTYLSGATSTIVYYADDTHLRDIIFLNPQWVTDTIYDILSYDIREKKENPGEFNRDHVERVLNQKGISELTDAFLELMKREFGSN